MNNSVSPADREPAVPTICVVIPMYNAAQTIVAALTSLAAQTHLPDHVVVVDDGSVDNGHDVVANYQAPYRLTLLRQTNQGPAAARNAGIRAAAEELICFLDADDAWLDHKLERQLALYCQLRATGHPVGIIDCFESIHYDGGRTTLANRVKNGFHFADFIRSNIINGTSCVMAARTALNDVGGFDTDIRYAEDRWLWTQIARTHEIHTVAEVLSRRYIGAGNITRNPARYYPHKVKFIEKYLTRYGAELTPHQRHLFVFENHSDFLRSFSRRHDYAKVIECFDAMLNESLSALWFDRGKPLVRYLRARLMSAWATARQQRRG